MSQGEGRAIEFELIVSNKIFLMKGSFNVEDSMLHLLKLDIILLYIEKYSKIL